MVDELLGMSSGMGRGIAKNNDLDVLLEVRINGYYMGFITYLLVGYIGVITPKKYPP